MHICLRPDSSTQDSDGNRKKAEQPAANKEIRGVVTLPDSAPAEQLVDVIAACPAFSWPPALADSKGKFSIDQQIRWPSRRHSKEGLLQSHGQGLEAGLECGQHFRKYIELSPNDSNIDAARNELVGTIGWGYSIKW